MKIANVTKGLKAQLKGLEDRRNNVHNLYILGVYDVEKYRRELDKLDALELSIIFSAK